MYYNLCGVTKAYNQMKMNKNLAITKKMAVNAARHGVTISRKEETFPSMEFAKQTGMDWLYTDWILPDTPDNLAYTLRNKPTKAFEIYAELVKLNPTLANIPVCDRVYDVVLGAISKFILDDIKFYVSCTNRKLMTYNLITNKWRVDRIEKITEAGLQWVASPQTMDRIEAELHSKTIG